MSAGRAIAWVAYRDGIGPFRNLPGDKVRTERWGGLHPEIHRPDKRHHLLWDVRWVLARVRWRLRQRPGPHRVPLPPLGPDRRYRLRGIARRNGVKSVAALLPLLWQDVRACNAEWAEHDRLMETAERELRQAVAGGQFTTEGRAGFRESNMVAPLVAMPLTVWRDPVMRLTKDDRLGPDADLRGDKRALLRFHDVQLLTAEVLAKWPANTPPPPPGMLVSMKGITAIGSDPKRGMPLAEAVAFYCRHLRVDKNLETKYLSLRARSMFRHGEDGALSEPERGELEVYNILFSQDLITTLRQGGLCGRGFAPGSERLLTMAAEWWQTVDLDLASNTAQSNGLLLTGVLIFPADEVAAAAGEGVSVAARALTLAAADRERGKSPDAALVAAEASASAVPVVDIEAVKSEIGLWMRKYAEGLKAAGKVAKREDAIAAARAALNCTARQAGEAFKELPYPELRNPPRIGSP